MARVDEAVIVKVTEAMGLERRPKVFEEFYYGIDSLEWMDDAGRYRPHFFGALLVAAGLVYAGYKVGEGFSDLADAIRRVAGKLDEIKDEIKRIADGIQEILEELKRLPDVIRGIVDDAFLRQAIVEATTLNEQIRRYLKDEATFRGNINRVADRVDDLESKTVLILDQLGRSSLSGFLTCASHVAVWAQGFTLVQAAIPGSTLTVWDTDFHNANRDAFLRLFDAAAAEKRKIEHHFTDGVFDAIPWQTPQFSVRLKEIRNGEFVPTNVRITSQDQLKDPGTIPGIQELLFVALKIENSSSMKYFGYLSYRIDDPNSRYRGKMVWSFIYPGPFQIGLPRDPAMRDRLIAIGKAFSDFHAALPQLEASLDTLADLPGARAKVEEAMTPPSPPKRTKGNNDKGALARATRQSK